VPEPVPEPEPDDEPLSFLQAVNIKGTDEAPINMFLKKFFLDWSITNDLVG